MNCVALRHCYIFKFVSSLYEILYFHKIRIVSNLRNYHEMTVIIKEIMNAV